MPRPCSICQHRERGLMEGAMLSGDSLRTIANRFATTAAALCRHRAHHIKSAATKPTAPEQEAPHVLAREPESREAELQIVLRCIPASVRERCLRVEGPYVSVPVNGRPCGPCPVCRSNRW